MAYKLGNLYYKITGDTRDIDKALKRTDTAVTKAGKALITAFSGAAVIAGLRKVAQFLGKTADAASVAEETLSKFNIVFKDQADVVREWAEEYSDSVGRATTETLGFAATLQDTFVPLGFARDEAADLSKNLVVLANDLASFNNLNSADVVRDLQSALVGNTETLRKYGVVASQAAIIQEAITTGLITTAGELDAQTKAQAIYQLAIKGTADAQGDLLRTQESAANVARTLESKTTELYETIGDGVNKRLTPFRSALSGIVEGLTDFIAKRQELKDLEDDLADANAALLAREAEREQELLVLNRSLEENADRQANVKRELDRVTQSIDAQTNAGFRASRTDVQRQAEYREMIQLLGQQEGGIKRKIAAVEAEIEADRESTEAAAEGAEERTGLTREEEEELERLRLKQLAIADANQFLTDLTISNAELRKQAELETSAAIALAELERIEAQTIAEQEFADEQERLRQNAEDFYLSSAGRLGDVFGRLIQAQMAGEDELSEHKKKSILNLYRLQQAANTAQVIVDTAAAIARQYKDLPIYAAIPASIIAGLAGAAQIAVIAGTPPPAFEAGGVVPGSSFTGDNVPIRANSGELVLTQEQQARLFEIANGSGGGGQMRVTVNLGEQAVIDTVQDLINRNEIIVEGTA